MLAKVNSAAVVGLEGQLVEVEVDISGGLPSMTIVGLPDTAVQESRERVRSAIRVARGKIIDEASLISALQEKRIAGAGLDVFEQEPLPSDSPLWKMANVIITTHTAGTHPQSAERSFQIFCENLKRFVAGQPLINVVDKQAGF